MKPRYIFFGFFVLAVGYGAYKYFQAKNPTAQVSNGPADTSNGVATDAGVLDELNKLVNG